MSNIQSFTTDASNTQPLPENITVKWGNVAGAAGYAVFFSTTTATLDQYFLATTTGQFTFSTSSASKTGSYSKDDTTAFSTLINPQGTSYINGNNGTATTTIASSSALEINGNLRAQSQSTTTNCYAAINEELFFNQANLHLWVCEGAGPTWTVVK